MSITYLRCVSGRAEEPQPRLIIVPTTVELPDDLRLTQFGEEPPFGDGFRDRLREDIGETEISMILGEVDAAGAAVLVTRYLTPAPYDA